MEVNEIYKLMDTKLLKESKPSEFFAVLLKEHQLDQTPFTMLSALVQTGQSPQHHAEGSVWNHTMLVIDEAAKIKKQAGNERVFMWAALLHDIGKAVTTKYRKGKVTAYNHDKVGAEMVPIFFNGFGEPEELICQVAAMVRWHMQILYVTKGLPFAQIEEMKQDVTVKDIALLGLCDRLGRFGSDRKKEENTIQEFIKKCK